MPVEILLKKTVKSLTNVSSIQTEALVHRQSEDLLHGEEEKLSYIQNCATSLHKSTVVGC